MIKGVVDQTVTISNSVNGTNETKVVVVKPLGLRPPISLAILAIVAAGAILLLLSR